MMRVALGDDIEDGAVRGERDILLETRNTKRRLPPHRSGVGWNLAAENLQERRFAGAVAADHRDALAPVDLHRDLVEQRKMTVRDRHPVQCYQRHPPNVPHFSYHRMQVRRRDMRRLVIFVTVPLVFAATLVAQPRLTLDYAAIAGRLVQQLALKPGERVLSIAHPGVFDDLLPYIRYEVMRAGGIDLGVVEVLREPVPETFEAAVLQKGARQARSSYKEMFRDVDAAIMMPGANTSHPAYLAMQDWLKDDLVAHRGRRTIHFHWIENGSAYPLAGQPLPSRPEMDGLYQRALLQTDYRALGEIERRFAAALKTGDVHITSAAGTDLRFRAGDRPANLQDGDASAARTAQGQVLVDHEIELPAGVVRIAPIEDTVEGT